MNHVERLDSTEKRRHSCKDSAASNNTDGKLISKLAFKRPTKGKWQHENKTTYPIWSSRCSPVWRIAYGCESATYPEKWGIDKSNLLVKNPDFFV